MKKIIKFLYIIWIIILLITGIYGFYYIIEEYQLLSKINANIIQNSDDKPLLEQHKEEIGVNNGNYLEKNYDRYVSYKSKHKDYTGDQIVSYVNIGLDSEFYTNKRPAPYKNTFMVLANKYNYLDKYIPDDLVNTTTKYSSTSRIKLNKTAYDAFKKLADDAKKLGYKIVITSGYRSYNLQNTLYTGYVKDMGKAKADDCSARPGYSEHQTGLAIDVYNESIAYGNFGKTKEFPWMRDNCHKYGYILRYPSGKTWITGYKSEPWHYRYVGISVATYIYEHKITFEEYYAQFLES